MARAKRSAGLLLWRRRAGQLEVLLVHPGGPFWVSKDAGSWTVPKGLVEEDEEDLACARREFAEETGMAAPEGEALQLGEVQQAGGKVVVAWALEGDCDVSTVRSNTFEMEWPPRSGKMAEFVEVDRAEWFGLEAAKRKINPAQREFLDRLASAISR